MHILLVEDDELIGEAVRERTKYFGYTVSWVKGGEAAKAAIQEKDCNYSAQTGYKA